MKKIILLIICHVGILYSSSNPDSLFLKPTKYIDCDNSLIVKKATELAIGCQTKEEVVQNLFEYVRDSYSNNVFDSYVASDIFMKGGNLCYQRAILLVALCRAAGIPARLHWQKVRIVDYRYRDGSIDDMVFIHGITGIQINGSWFLFEPVGNPAKWSAWVQQEEAYEVQFQPHSDCLFKNTDKITTVTLPIFFADHYDIFPDFWDHFTDGEIGFLSIDN